MEETKRHKELSTKLSNLLVSILLLNNPFLVWQESGSSSTNSITMVYSFGATSHTAKTAALW